MYYPSYWFFLYVISIFNCIFILKENSRQTMHARIEYWVVVVVVVVVTLFVVLRSGGSKVIHHKSFWGWWIKMNHQKWSTKVKSIILICFSFSPRRDLSPFCLAAIWFHEPREDRSLCASKVRQIERFIYVPRSEAQFWGTRFWYVLIDSRCLRDHPCQISSSYHYYFSRYELAATSKTCCRHFDFFQLCDTKVWHIRSFCWMCHKVWH